MVRVLCCVFVALAVLWVAKAPVSGQQTTSTETTRLEPLLLRATTVGDLRTWDLFVTEAARSGALRLRSATVDPMMPSRVVERFQQFHDGVPIWGADVVRDSERGIPMSIFGEVSPELPLATTPELSRDDAVSAMLAFGGSDNSAYVYRRG